MPLKDFNKKLNLCLEFEKSKIFEKEIMPYKSYNLKNIEEKVI